MCLVDLVQHMWRTGVIPHEFVLTVLVLIPKGTTNTRVIGMLDTLWKVVEALIGTHIHTSLHINNALHYFRARRGTGKSIMEINLAKDIASIDQDPLFLVFLDLRNAYDTLDRDRLIITL